MLGCTLIPIWEADGAALAASIGETMLAARRDGDARAGATGLRPKTAVRAEAAAGGGARAGCACCCRGPDAVAAVLAVAVYGVVALAAARRSCGAAGGVRAAAHAFSNDRLACPRWRTDPCSRANEAIFARRTFEAGESRLRKAFELVADEARRGRLLDVAAGSGIAARAFSAQGWEVSALEISPELIEQSKAGGYRRRA